MKPFGYLVVLALITGAMAMPQRADAQPGSSSYQLFYDDLSPYGTWTENPSYGYVWMPTGIPGFSPYETGGHWVLTDDGWMWDSDYPWGWAAFHYGRWDFDDSYGWFWVPDNEWGPAWVSWRSSPGYYGWAPLRPGISVSVSFGAGYHERNERWIFVRDGDIGRDDIGRRYIDRGRNAAMINNSTVIVNSQRDDNRHVTYVAGPNRDDVQKATHTTLKPVAVREAAQPGQHINNGELQVYRPQVQKDGGSGTHPAPSKVEKLADVKSTSARAVPNRQQEPQTAAPQRNPQPLQPRNINSADRKQPAKRVPEIAPTQRVQQQRPQNANPSSAKATPQQPRRVKPPIKTQPTPRQTNPSNNGGRAKQPQNIAPPNRNPRVPPSQPKTKRDEKGAMNIEQKASRMLTNAILTIYTNQLFIQSGR